MLQFQCVKITACDDQSQALIQFVVLLEQKRTGQQVELLLPPDFCDVGSVFNLTDQDFEIERAAQAAESNEGTRGI
jgi:hypothetical protein